MFLFHPTAPFTRLSGKLESLMRGRLWLQALTGMVLGVLVGMLLGPDVRLLPEDQVLVITAWLALPGEIFLRLIKMVLVPLLIASIIRGLGGSEDIKRLRSVGLRFFVYILCTTTVATTIGLTVASVIEPGQYVSVPGEAQVEAVVKNGATTERKVAIAEKLPSSLVALVPENPLRSALEGEMLGVVIFSVIIGIAFAVRHNRKIKPLLGLLDGVLEICMTIVQWAMWLVPFAVFGLLTRMVAQVGKATLFGMGVYMGSVLIGLLILLLFYCMLVFVLGRMNPGRFLRAAAPVQLLAFSTSSSAAVMPLSIRTAEEELDTENDAAEVIVPLGATMNMDGTALYQSVALLFLAQMSGIELSLAQMVLMVSTLVLSSIGAPATPGVGMVILGSVAANVGIPTAGLILIVGVDRILDMCRTALNVTGDLAACVILGRKRHPFAFWRREKAR